MPAPNVEEVQVPCSLFLGLNTEVAPIDLPEGASPDNQDVAYVPGSVFSRPCLHKIFGAAFPGSPTVTYAETFDQPNADPLNLYMTSDGKFSVEDILNSPGAYTLLAQIITGLQAQSVTASGAEYIAFSDGLRGQDVPRQVYRTPDGTLRCDRVSQDGPGAGPTVADYLQSVTVTSSTVSTAGIGFGGGAIVSITESGNSATVTYGSAHNLLPGQIIVVTNPSVAGYAGIQTVSTVPSTTTLTYILTATGLGAAGAQGFAIPAIGALSIPFAHTPNPLPNIGDPITITGSGTGFDNNATGNPPNWPLLSIVTVPGPNVRFFYFSIAAGNPLGDYSGAATPGKITMGGMSTPGVHQVVCMFLTRSGYLTQPSPPLSFVSVGNSQWNVTNLPLGPPNVIARVLGFTGAGGDNFFAITSPLTFPNPTSAIGTPIVIAATIVPDNTSTSVLIDVSDNALFGAQGIDIPGNNLFEQVVLGPCLGFFYYASRLIAWGMSNRLENFLNMGFEGGTLSGSPNSPLAWTGFGAGGSLVAGVAGFGVSWNIAGNSSGSRRGELTQTAFENALGVAIVRPSTLYDFRCYIQTTPGAVGILHIDLNSPGTGLLASATIDLSTVHTGGFYEATFSAAMPAAIPADTVLDIYAIGSATGSSVTIDELEVIPTYDPYFQSFLISYVDNFEAFDGVTGVMGPTADPNPLRGCETIRDQLQFLTTGGMHQTSDNGQEPSSWQVSEISNDTGLAATRALDAGEECIVFVSKSGGGNGSNPTYALRIFEGGQPWKISQEVQSIFDNINPAAEQTMWLVNDIGQRRIYIGVPTGAATAPNLIYVLDYREIDTAYQMATAASIHISFTGKMIASDLARKWTRWNIQANCGAMLARSAQNVQLCLGAGNGVAPGGMAGFGNVYFLDPAKKTDDDYGVMSPYYDMYFFISRDAETALGVGAMRKLYKRVSEFISGVGILTITPFAASLTNPWPSPPSVHLSLAPIEDIYHGLNVSAERMGIKFSITPLPGTTDVQFNLQHMEATVVQHPMSPVGTGGGL